MNDEKLGQLAIHWPLVIKTIYPDIDMIPVGDPGSCESLLATWRGDYPAPTSEQLEAALDHVLENLPDPDPLLTLSELQAQLSAIQAQINALIGEEE